MSNSNLRQNEIDCFVRIKDSFINHNGLIKTFDNSDHSLMKRIFDSARHNEHHDEFPDFFFDGGIIEHFEVFSSKETRKGSNYKIDTADDKKELDAYFKEKDEGFLSSEYRPGKVVVEGIEIDYECFSYDYFVDSIKKHADDHLFSLMNSKFLNTTVVFLIEQQSGRLGIYSNNEFDRFYKLSEDKKLLLYIRNSLFSYVDYIIFNSVDAYEILDLSKIDELILNSSDNLDIRGNKQRNISLKIYADTR